MAKWQLFLIKSIRRLPHNYCLAGPSRPSYCRSQHKSTAKRRTTREDYELIENSDQPLFGCKTVYDWF